MDNLEPMINELARLKIEVLESFAADIVKTLDNQGFTLSDFIYSLAGVVHSNGLEEQTKILEDAALEIQKLG